MFALMVIFTNGVRHGCLLRNDTLPLLDGGNFRERLENTLSDVSKDVSGFIFKIDSLPPEIKTGLSEIPLHNRENLREILESSVLEAPDEVYKFVLASFSKKTITNLQRKNALYVVNVSVQESIITECKVDMFCFHASGDYLLEPVRNSTVLEKIFLNKKIDFPFMQGDGSYAFTMKGEDFVEQK